MSDDTIAFLIFEAGVVVISLGAFALGAFAIWLEYKKETDRD